MSAQFKRQEKKEWKAHKREKLFEVISKFTANRKDFDELVVAHQMHKTAPTNHFGERIIELQKSRYLLDEAYSILLLLGMSESASLLGEIMKTMVELQAYLARSGTPNQNDIQHDMNFINEKSRILLKSISDEYNK